MYEWRYEVMMRLSIVSYFFVEGLGAFEGSHNHLTEDRLLLLKFCELFLEVIIFLFLVDHSQLQWTVQRLDEGSCSLEDLLIYVLYFGSHRVQLLPEQFNEFVVFLQIFIGFSGEVLFGKVFTSTMPRWPVAWVEFCVYLSGDSERWLMRINKINITSRTSNTISLSGIYFKNYHSVVRAIPIKEIETRHFVKVVGFWLEYSLL